MIYGRLTECWCVGDYREKREIKVEAIGAAILSQVFGSAAAAFTIGATSVTLASVVGYTVVTASLIGAQFAVSALAGKPDQSVKPTENSLNIRQAIVSRRRSYGEVKIGGITWFEEKDSGAESGPTSGDSVGGGGGSNNLLIGLLQGQGEINSVLEHWLGDEQVLLNSGTGLVNGPPFATNLGGVWVRNKLGTANQTAHARLISLFEPDVNVNHRWRGVPNTLIEYKAPVDVESAQKIYPYGPQPYRAVQHTAKVHDPRIDTQDADGDPDNPVTAGWLYSDNNALVILDFLRHPDGFATRSDREMVPISEFHVPDFISLADICDEPVERKDGSGPIPRYRVWGTYDLTSSPKNILQGLLDSCDSELYRTGTGKIGIRGGVWSEPTVTIASDNLLSHSIRKGARQYAACNRINAKYISRQHDYQQVEMDPWLDQDNIDLRRQELPIDIDYGWVAHHSQARRISKIQIHKRNPDWIGTIVTGPRGLLAFNERIIQVQIEELGIDRPFWVTSFRPSPNFATVEIGISALDASAYEWDPATEEGDAPFISAVTLDDSILPLPENVEYETVPTGTPGQAYATGTWENNSDLTLFGQVQYQDVTIINPPFGFPLASAVVGSAWIDVPVPEDLSESSPVIVNDPGAYVFRVRFVSPSGRASKWVESTPIILGTMSFDFSNKLNSGYLPLI